MKLSDFLKPRKIKLYKDENGEQKCKPIEPELPEGEIIFNNINTNLVNEIDNIKKDIKDISDEKLMYKLFEKLTNIELDVEEEKFCDMILFPPNDCCAMIGEGLYKSFVALMKGVKNKFQISYNNTKEINNVLNDFPEEFKEKMLEQLNPKTDEEILIELKEKIKDVTDSNEQQKLILEAWKLQEKINKKLNKNKEIIE